MADEDFRIKSRTADRRRKAAALRYDLDQDTVPRLVAKGTGPMADRIVELAREHGIAVREDPDLINLLTKLEVDQLIPETMFLAVAEVMAYVYRLNNRAAEVEQIRRRSTPTTRRSAP